MSMIMQKSRTKITTKELVTIGLLAALAYVLMLLHLPFKYLGFLEIEFSDIPAIFAALQFGPLAGVFVEMVKNLIKALSASTTSGVGELANFIISSAYVIPVGILYKIRKGWNGKAESGSVNSKKESSDAKKNAFIILIFVIGTICMTATGAILNYYVTVPLYAKLYGGMDVIVGASEKYLSVVKDLKTLVLLGITPFNVVKGAGMSIIGYYTYKYLKNRI